MSRKVVSGQLEGVDERWSCVIAVACFFSNLVLAEAFRSSPFLSVEYLRTYGVSTKEAVWPMEVCIAVLYLTGPFSGILGQRFGIRPIIITGSIIATIGISSCYFTTSLTLITVLFGGVFGIGYGFINTLLPVILNSYFLNLRASANGIAYSGGCIPFLILPNVFEELIDKYELPGCFLLTGGLVLHIAVVGALMRPPPWMKNQIAKEKHKRLELKSFYIKSSGDASCKEDGHVYTNIGSVINEKYEATADDGDNQKRRYMVEYESSGPFDLLDSESKLMESSNSNASKESTTRTLPSTISSSFTSVLTSPMFYITAVTNICFEFLFHMYFMIIVDYVLDGEVVEVNTPNILFAFTLSNFFGRLCLGWITDCKFISRSRFVMLCMLLIGVIHFAFPHASSYIPLMIVSSVYGLLFGCTMTIFPILLVDFCGIEHHAVAFGCMCFLNGIVSFGRPFLIGYFQDSIGSHSSMFYILGSLSVIASSLWFFEMLFVKKHQVEPTDRAV